jgi:hypothetical protein
MAKKTFVRLFDDLSGDEIDTDLVGIPTRSFSVDGVEYEIDLGTKNQEQFETDLAPYIAAARRLGGRKQTRRSPIANGKPTNSPPRNQAGAIREWAIKKGVDVPARGRLPRTVIDLYHDAMSASKSA